MITIHDRSANDFTASGLAVLDRHLIDPKVTQELNGKFSLTFSYPLDGPAANLLAIENIVAAPVPGISGRQGFRISELATSLDGTLKVVAHHVFYDLSANLIAATYVVNKTAKAALAQLLGAANSPYGFSWEGLECQRQAMERTAPWVQRREKSKCRPRLCTEKKTR
ncbi:phage tail spike protein [Actinotignum urinale]|uniref:Phage tail spike protein n=2 Tax=Actinotignum urinale TaxID=190146 RepID=A0AAW9HP33_9ACTO|nr:phage tail spike protein [Actinotignum urinale]MDY5155646.1 phage tail spike protein [Actinotignum urinale]